MVSKRPLVSVVIPVFNDLERLAGCLSALSRQTYPCYEVIVVDNGSDAHLNPLALTSQHAFVRAAVEPRPGAYAARNRGLQIARGEILAFTDADCVPAEDWLAKGIGHMTERPELGLLAGEIEVFVEHLGPPTAVEIYEQAVAFDPRKLLRTEKYGVTANLFTFRSVLDRVGWFNDDLKSGGDLEWGKRVHAAGFEQAFAADVRVAHPARSSSSGLYRRAIRFAGSRYDRRVRPQRNKVMRQTYFLTLLMLDLAAIPCAVLYHLGLDPRVRGFRNRLKYAAVSAWVRGVSVLEQVRLNLGKPSSRS